MSNGANTGSSTLVRVIMLLSAVLAFTSLVFDAVQYGAAVGGPGFWEPLVMCVALLAVLVALASLGMIERRLSGDTRVMWIIPRCPPICPPFLVAVVCDIGAFIAMLQGLEFLGIEVMTWIAGGSIFANIHLMTRLKSRLK